MIPRHQKNTQNSKNAAFNKAKKGNSMPEKDNKGWAAASKRSL